MIIRTPVLAATLIACGLATTPAAQADIFDLSRTEKVATSTTGRGTTREAAEHVSTLMRPTKEEQASEQPSGHSSQPPRVPVCVLVSFRLICV